jgi:hypothetical protein
MSRRAGRLLLSLAALLACLIAAVIWSARPGNAALFPTSEGGTDAAGIPTTPLASLLPIGILTDLKWRSGLTALPAAQ